nr:hypothetical protein Iba_chr04cCG8950 [Ipomoea batatas]
MFVDESDSECQIERREGRALQQPRNRIRILSVGAADESPDGEAPAPLRPRNTAKIQHTFRNAVSERESNERRQI